MPPGTSEEFSVTQEAEILTNSGSCSDEEEDGAGLGSEISLVDSGVGLGSEARVCGLRERPH